MEAVVVWGLKGSLFLSVLALGLRASTRDATYLLRRTEPLARAILAMNGIMGLFAIVLIASFDFRPVVKLALAAIAVSPVPPLFPRKALKAGGETNYAIGLLVAAALASIVLIPLSMEVLRALFRIPLQMPAPKVAALTVTTIFLPLAAGIALRRLLPSFSERVARPLAVLALVVLLGSFLFILYAAHEAMLSLIGSGTVLAFVAFSVAGLAAGHVLGRPDGDNRVVLALATATRHPAIAIAVAHWNFPDQPLSAAAVLLYFIVTAIASGIYLAWRRGAAAARARREQH